MANKYKQATLSISEDELNAIEDLFSVKLDIKQRRLAENKLRIVYNRIVKSIK